MASQRYFPAQDFTTRMRAQLERDYVGARPTVDSDRNSLPGVREGVPQEPPIAKFADRTSIN